jgi:hypothetical protein
VPGAFPSLEKERPGMICWRESALLFSLAGERIAFSLEGEHQLSRHGMRKLVLPLAL